MQKNSGYLLFEAIKSDDVTAFLRIFDIKGAKNYAFGRFPILSVCYLYNAKNIIKKFEKNILAKNEFEVLEEPFVLYQKFKSVAGNSIRVYANKQCSVSPIEMLAVLGQDGKVKKIFKNFCKNQQITNNLKYIYKIKNQETEIKKDKIKIQTKFNYSELKFTKTSLFACVGFCFLILASWFLVGISIGNGSRLYPMQISTGEQFLSALNIGGNFTVEKDLKISNPNTMASFDGVIDGKGNTLTIETSFPKALVQNNKGKIKNLNLIIKCDSIELSKSLSFVCFSNNGTIENVCVQWQGQFLTQNNEQKAIYISAITEKNYGYIKNCRAMLNLNAESENSGESFLSGCAGENFGTISNFALLEQSSITTKNIDISGVAIINNEKGTISSCKNHASLSQSSDATNWSPNVAGISIQNYGSITNCINYGNLSVSSDFATESTQSIAYIAGICNVNYSKVQHCLNKANLLAKTKQLSIYAGGICAFSSNYQKSETQINYSYILNCGMQGNIDASVENDKVFCFVGGISGFCHGYLENCYSTAIFATAYNKNGHFAGLLIGGSYISYNLIYVTLNNNYVLEQENIPYHVGCGVLNYIYYQVTSVGGVTSMQTEQQIQNTEVYWNE